MLVLSLFPGIGILDRAFEAEGFTVVRGPDLLWGGDIRRFHVPAGRFDGVIGGSPCQAFTRLVHLIRYNGYAVAPDLVPEFVRVVAEAQPAWFVMENVVDAPIPHVDGYQVDPTLLNNRWLGNVQSRLHRFSFGTRDGRRLLYETTVFEPLEFESRVLAKHDALPQLRRTRSGDLKVRGGVSARRGRGNYRTVEACCELQGLPRDFFANSPFTRARQRQMLGNAVPYPMGRELARAIRRALGLPIVPTDENPPGESSPGHEPPSALTLDPGTTHNQLEQDPLQLGRAR
jgi:DNA (cytosine-5)-methyltransferase 1